MLVWQPQGASAQTAEPIAFIGHGAFFDAKGQRILPTAAFVRQAQAWYSAHLATRLGDAGKQRVRKLEQALGDVLQQDGQTALVARQRVLEQQLVMVPKGRLDPQMAGKIRLLGERLRTDLADANLMQWQGAKPFVLPIDVQRRLDRLPAGGISVFSATINTGQAYINECAAAGVPIPPPINDNAPGKWVAEGAIPIADQFITGTVAEIKSYSTATGVCIALPRQNGAGTNIMLDGVICMSRTTSKVCYWDNQQSDARFDIGFSERVPIGVADLAINAAGKFMAGGFELEGGSGGVCTDCHAGENTYIVHPKAVLRPGPYTFEQLVADRGMFTPQRYDPLVAASWPQNNLSHSPALTPGACSGCHVQGAAGRLPHLSSALPAYCTFVLQQAIARTMPPGAGGSLNGTPAMNDQIDWCNQAPGAGPVNRGDPHIVTTNGTDYDFHAAGEFTALRNSATGFELQTRQTPVVTGFRAGPNPHTGLDGCVSVNTAAAVQLGKHRITYQPGDTGGRERMLLRVDGRPARLPARGLAIGGGRIVTASSGTGVEVRAPDGSRVILTPLYWEGQGVWYLNVDVLKTPAREGVMGHVRKGDWLPLAPDGSSFGAAPAALGDRHVLLNEKFADAWRVQAGASLFDYAPGTSSATYTDRSWPAAPGGVCSVPKVPAIGTRIKVVPLSPDRAKALCAALKDAHAQRQCFFDATVMGDLNLAKAYGITLANRQ